MSIERKHTIVEIFVSQLQNMNTNAKQYKIILNHRGKYTYKFNIDILQILHIPTGYNHN